MYHHGWSPLLGEEQVEMKAKEDKKKTRPSLMFEILKVRYHANGYLNQKIEPKKKKSWFDLKDFDFKQF